MRISDGIIMISVRELIEFVLRQGSIYTSFIGSNRAVQGTIAHKKIQNSMDANYEAEVTLVHECIVDQIPFVIEGRADGIIKDLIGVTIDEIKSTTTNLEKIEEDYNKLHWAQVKCYAYMYANEYELKEIQVRLTYYHLETKKRKYFTKYYQYNELKNFFEAILKKYSIWMNFYKKWIKKRNVSLQKVSFPFSSYRIGQRELAVYVYKSIRAAENLYINAPTGIGKTISTLFPTLKAMGEGYINKIFYLTAKTITRTVAEQAAKLLYEEGARIKVVTLTAKDKICLCDKVQCNPEYCTYADGHFDRVDEVVYQMLESIDLFTRDIILEYAKCYRVCPFELSLDLTLWADVIICDYNYLFDPAIGLKRFQENKENVWLIDEAHNLVDRARNMYSSSVSKRQIQQVKKTIGNSYKSIKKELTKLNQYLLDIRKDYIEVTGSYVSQEAPKDFYALVKRFLQACEKNLQKVSFSHIPTELMDLYFDLYHFVKIFELFDEHYQTYAQMIGQEVILTMFCIDPSEAIRKITNKCQSVVFFSATLLPIDYFKYMLGGKEDKAITFPSPFESEHVLRLIAKDVSTRYRDRENSYHKITKYIDKVVRGKVGNYIVFFPSYKYMIDTYTFFIQQKAPYKIYIQEQNMQEKEREIFLERFVPQPKETTIHFCVLGGIFSEGIDLTKDRLIGVIVVGVGLPQLSLERELIKGYFSQLNKNGYHYAYTYPGINKVLQAVGRLIRTEEDVGTVLLIDDRFLHSFYQELFLLEFTHTKIVDMQTIDQEVNHFWRE